MRSVVRVRSITPTDLDAVVELVLDARGESSVASQICSPDAAAVAAQVGALTAIPGGTVLLAQDDADGALVGLLLGRLVEPNLFTDATNLYVEAVYVAAGHRRHGVGRALMSEAVAHAAANGAEHVFAAPIPGARGMQRFLVQLGFAAAAGHRVASTTALQRRLADEPASRRSGARAIEDLIARRRQSRDGGPRVAAEVRPAAGA